MPVSLRVHGTEEVDGARVVDQQQLAEFLDGFSTEEEVEDEDDTLGMNPLSWSQYEETLSRKTDGSSSPSDEMAPWMKSNDDDNAVDGCDGKKTGTRSRND